MKTVSAHDFINRHKPSQKRTQQRGSVVDKYKTRPFNFCRTRIDERAASKEIQNALGCR
jgi:hypothetical protein